MNTSGFPKFFPKFLSANICLVKLYADVAFKANEGGITAAGELL